MDFGDLKDAIERQYGGTAIRLQTVPVTERVGARIVWDGLVHVFVLSGHPRATRAYAWSMPIAGSERRQYFAVLHSGAVTCPQEAVRSVIRSDRRADC